MFENDKQKLKERQKNLNRCMSQKGLRQRTEHFIENIKELLTPERFKKWRGLSDWKEISFEVK